MSAPQSPDRFNEDAATYAVKGADAPDLDAGVAAIRNVLATLPNRPGVYRMQDARGDTLYVGKARSLKSRVGNYVQVAALPKRLQRMVAQTRGMLIVTTNNEAEALLLEAQLIKRYRPAYNVLLRDDKSFPFILLRADHAFPRIQKHRGARRAKGNYYGPFASAGSVNVTLNALQKLFLLRSCTDSFFNNRDRPCLLYQIKRCSAPCVGRISADDYGELVGDAKAYLGGKSTQVQTKWARDAASRRGHGFRTRCALPRPAPRADLYPGDAGNQRRLGGRCRHCGVGLQERRDLHQAFFIRGGANWGHRAFFPAHTADVPEDEVLASFLMQFTRTCHRPRRSCSTACYRKGRCSKRHCANAQGTASRLPCPSAVTASASSNRRRAMPKKRSTAVPPNRRRRANCCAMSPNCSSWRGRPNASKSMTTAIFRAPIRSAQ